MINIIYKNPKILVCYKESGLPTAPLKNSTNDNLVSQVSIEYPEIMDVKGFQAWEGGLLHRLDTPTSGLVLFALAQDAFDYLVYQQKNDMIIKEYRAKSKGAKELLPGFPPFIYDECSSIISGFRNYGPKGASVRPVLPSDNQKVYKTEVIREGDDSFICTITQGFRHQIRCHMAWSSYPLIGDEKYGGFEGEFGLEAIGLTFKDPVSRKVISIKI